MVVLPRERHCENRCWNSISTHMKNTVQDNMLKEVTVNNHKNPLHTHTHTNRTLQMRTSIKSRQQKRY